MKTIALLGNPNVGKTTLFNILTGSNQRVGNWAGVTVDRKDGCFDDFKIVDLPVPAEPYNTINFCMFFDSPDTIEPIDHSILCLSSGEYKVEISLSNEE